MVLNSLLCADVPLRNCSLTHSIGLHVFIVGSVNTLSTVVDLNCQSQLNIQTSNIDSSLEGGAQKQQTFNVECVHDFSEPPVITLHFL